MLSRTVLLGILLAVIAPIAGAVEEGDKVLHQGTWTKKGYSVQGGWKIVQNGGKLFVDLDKSFKTKKAPDLKLFLSPSSLAKLGDKNATTKAVKVALLKSNKGAQRFEIPAKTDLSKLTTLVLHCEKYSKLWGAAELRPAKKQP